jgi:hypothetical protein
MAAIERSRFPVAEAIMVLIHAERRKYWGFGVIY